jgi:ppGpp synthetase/RelA/SpoT-type nucleotidyltranferase
MGPIPLVKILRPLKVAVKLGEDQLLGDSRVEIRVQVRGVMDSAWNRVLVHTLYYHNVWILQISR